MHFEKTNFGYFLAFLIVGGIMGAALGSLLVAIFPQVAIITKSLTGPVGFSLEIIDLHVRLNISSIIGCILGLIIFCKA